MSAILAPFHPSQPEEVLPPLDPAQIPNHPSDHLPAALILSRPSPVTDGYLPLPPVVLGCATFGYGIYAEKSDCLGPDPVQVVRYALRAGINAFDTSPFYHPSELVLGRALSLLRQEFPRASYTLITKAGKYGPKVSDHVYDPATIRATVERSLRRFGTDYLDVVYLHDAEFVASHPRSGIAGHHLPALSFLDPYSSVPTNRDDDVFHLSPPHIPLGEGDLRILSALSTLRELQEAGKIRRIGISAYPLPVLLRIALLARHNTPFKPLDIVQTYAHQTLLNDSLAQGYLDALTERAGVGQVMNAAPLAMGVLTDSGGPTWHPIRSASGGIYEVTKEARELCRSKKMTLEEVAAEFGFRELRQKDGKVVPVVIGCKSLDEVKRTLESHRKAREMNGKEGQVETEMIELFERKGVRGYSWAVPSEEGKVPD